MSNVLDGKVAIAIIKEPASGIVSISLALAIAAIFGTPAKAQSITAGQPHWVGSWGADPAFPNGPEIANQTIRQVVRLSLGGHAVRIRLSNEMGAGPLVIGAAHIAYPGQASGSIDPATDRVLTFGGRTFVTLPPGAPALSDPVVLDIKALDRLSISLFVPARYRCICDASAWPGDRVWFLGRPDRRGNVAERHRQQCSPVHQQRRSRCPGRRDRGGARRFHHRWLLLDAQCQS